MPSLSESIVRKVDIDPKLDACRWRRARVASVVGACRTEEHPTAHGPADYALFLDGKPVAIVEAKKTAVDPENVLTQAERYGRGLEGSPHDFDGIHVPFLYSTNGEKIWFRDVRHPLNRCRQVADFHTPDALRALLGRDFDGTCASLLAMPNGSERLRQYQRQANTAVEHAIAERKRNLLLAMATGTGKTFTIVNQIYRLMKAGVARRVLFLVDRRALAAQAVRTFRNFDAEPGQKFNQVYEVYSNRFQREDFDEGEKFDPTVMPNAYLTEPDAGHAFVYISTIQRMAINVLGRDAIFGTGDEPFDTDVDRLDIPIHAFDLIVADECHRGYTAAEISVWRDTLNHFDGIKIGLTATPAKHTTGYFGAPVFHYSFDQAVADGHLVDYDLVAVRSNVRMTGVFLKEGEEVERVDLQTGARQLDLLEDERQFDPTEIERKVTAPESNRKIIDEVKQHALAHEQEHGRFPKTLIFAANDLPHASHAQQLVDICRNAFGRGDAFVDKITGTVDRPLQRIRQFRNRTAPAIVVTVDLLTTGVDIPDLEFLVFLRPIKSRILFTQMLGRGTRKGEKYPDKSHFTVFDCFDGTLFEYFRKTSDETNDYPAPPSRPTAEIIDDIWQNRDRDYNIRCLVKRLQRIDKQMSAEARDQFAAFIPEGDVARFAAGLTTALHQDFTRTMGILRNAGFQTTLEDYPRALRTFVIAPEVEDQVSSRTLLADGSRPEDYLEAFARFVRENRAQVAAIRILLDRPTDWNVESLRELRNLLARSQLFTERRLEEAHRMRYQRALVDVISMVKHAADEGQPLLTAEERVNRALAKLSEGHAFTDDQQKWLDRIGQALRENLSLEPDDFGILPILERAGGLGAARRAFGMNLDRLIDELNAAVAA
jgi:type I restriction enzyme, R subunit